MSSAHATACEARWNSPIDRSRVAFVWTPISERLPSHGQRVLVWRQREIGRGFADFSACRYTTSGPRWDCEAGATLWIPLPLRAYVTHWAEIPEAPKP